MAMPPLFNCYSGIWLFCKGSVWNLNSLLYILLSTWFCSAKQRNSWFWFTEITILLSCSNNGLLKNLPVKEKEVHPCTIKVITELNTFILKAQRCHLAATLRNFLQRNSPFSIKLSNNWIPTSFQFKKKTFTSHMNDDLVYCL